ncbi:acyloxyacyl hydrolase-like [Centruroides sculpturatus]|uniref:acyloxyacyl hydrolase-like n=1 Tax=Centruroides sculpturatus TaxID=218467 RepID=UPI000C6EF635|nr:acyloxyacyl hydrolase-like [Centruroides sculpturatus]XP_023233423.1 acyloxyacyl hydrolase-like [Centruroides sculpturatus]
MIEILIQNCNGIWGTDKITGEPYEKELCERTNPRGLVYIGDSVGARLHVPLQWFTAREFLKKYFTHLEFILGNELDWPETSFATGYKNFSWPTLQGYTDSLYFRLREHNLCNHRDYQNLAVNGIVSYIFILQ